MKKFTLSLQAAKNLYMSYKEYDLHTTCHHSAQFKLWGWGKCHKIHWN